jgi:long-subunit acyl-CoA synthetase (AMP-forming)
LIDDNGNDITDYDVRGELCVRGPTVIREYLNNPKANAESWDEEGFFKTGDIVYCDRKTGKWYIVDRKKVCSHIQTVVKAVLTSQTRSSSKSAVFKSLLPN